MPKNVIVAQSGGPSPVINASLQGVIDACREYPDHFSQIYAAQHGIEGVLTENLIDINTQPEEEIKLLQATPAAGAIGTCRYKLGEGHEDDYKRILNICRAHDVGYFFYIGGNDSMDTAHKIAVLAKTKGIELIATGVPKTIDNDVGDSEFTLIDHTPGYGSTARYWAYITQIVNEENAGMCPSERVSVLQAMGRTSGYIPAAARLADPERQMPLHIYTAESDHTLETLYENVAREIEISGRCIVIVSEGFNVGSLGEAHDGFGHIEYGASKTTVAQKVVNFINDRGLPRPGQATGQVPGVLQRCCSCFASRQDRTEAYEVGRKAVDIALNDGSGWMATILRAPGDTYKPVYDKVPLDLVANAARTLPPHWLTDNQLDVTDDFISYAQPLIGEDWPDMPIVKGIQRFARIKPILCEKVLPEYTPVNYR